MKDYLELSDDFIAAVSGGASEDEEFIYETMAKSLLAQLKTAWSQFLPEDKQELQANLSVLIDSYRNILQAPGSPLLSDEMFQRFENELREIVNNL